MGVYARTAGIVMLVLTFCAACVLAADLSWENISGEIIDVNTVLVDRSNPEYVYAGTGRGVFTSRDAGRTWKAAGRLNGKINFLVQDNRGIVYAASAAGIFITNDQGSSWKKIFGGRDHRESNCRALAVCRDEQVIIGTDAGLFTTKDRGRNWHRENGRLGSACVVSLAQDSLNDIIYAATRSKVFKLNRGAVAYEAIFTAGSEETQGDSEDDGEDSEGTPAADAGIRSIAVGSCKMSRLYLAARSGVRVSDDQGLTWNRITDFGLLSKDIQQISLSRQCGLYAVTAAGIFLFRGERWQELSLRLPVRDIRSLAMDSRTGLYAATDKGVFRAAQDDLSADAGSPDADFEHDAQIKQLHAAAIRYAQVIDPARIDNLRKQARLKAALPTLSLDYDKTVTSYSNSASTRFEVGPSDWGVSLKWDLSDLIWSEQQRLIDSQARLMVVLRNDILDEVNKLYFERRRVKMELACLSPNEYRKAQEKKLRLEELVASLDALTGGYFSRQFKD